jgi:mannose-6-phosphate isomerase-like protein (cupin superfamily)
MDIKKYIESGVLEQYVLGTISAEELLQVEQMVIMYPEIKEEILSISYVLEQLAIENAVSPDQTIKPFIMATIDFMERMENGEQPSFPPILNKDSRLADFASWIDRDDMVLLSDAGDLYAKIIGYTPEVTTAIAWIKGNAPVETHDKEYEKFLIIEGTCDIVVEDTVYQLVPGDYFAIPLHKSHQVRVTSIIPCKVILQRIAA